MKVREEESVYFTSDIMDFWRPVYADQAFVDGKLSNEQYIAFFSKVWEKYKTKTGLELKDFEAMCYHLPYTKMGLKALRTILDEGTEDVKDRLNENYNLSAAYNRIVGNIYTGSLYLSLLSLLEQKEDLKAGSRIGLFSYGSGAVGEFFTGILQPNFRQHVQIENHTKLFSSRTEITVSEYEEIFQETLPTDGSTIELDIDKDPAAICLAGMADNKRLYVNKVR